MPAKPVFEHRTCYVNFAEHLQNSWNANLLYPNAPGVWPDADWRAFFVQLREFGYTNFQFWIAPTIVVPGKARDEAAASIRNIIEIAHAQGIKVNPAFTANTIGAGWYYACPNDAADRERILEFWDYYATNLKDADIYGIAPGDPGGCNRNGCDHVTFIELALEISELIARRSPGSISEISTWGTPFTGWGDDLIRLPGWDGSFRAFMDYEENKKPGDPFYFWLGAPDRVKVCMEDLIRYLPKFHADTVFSVNLGFNPDCDPACTYGGRVWEPEYAGGKWAAEIAKTRRVTTWDYSLSEGELINYPHWRLPRMQRKRLLEAESAPYYGAMNYTMTPKLNMLTLFAGARMMIDPAGTPEKLSSEFTRLVFGDPEIGPLMEAFEIVKGWGHYPRRAYTKRELKNDYTELIRRLEACRGAKCELPLFPGPETYRQDLIWHAKNFLEMTQGNADRAKIRGDYWEKALTIYNAIPMSVDKRADMAADSYSRIGLDME